MVQTFFAALTVAVCLVLLVRLALGPQRRARLDRWATWRWQALVTRVVGLWRYRSAKREAERLAQEAIRRARSAEDSAGEWDGNVYRPDKFKKPPRNKMH